jgi:cytochrome c oxidase subunit II
MNDEQDREQEGIVGWVIGIAAFIAVAVALWMGLMAAFNGENPRGQNSATAPVTVPAPATEIKTATPALTIPSNVSLFFAVNQISPPADAAQKLDALINYGRANPNAKIAVSGFADKTGDPEKNAQLSKERAQAIRNQLISAGMPEDRIMLQKPQSITGDQGNDLEARRVDVYVVQ